MHVDTEFFLNLFAKVHHSLPKDPQEMFGMAEKLGLMHEHTSPGSWVGMRSQVRKPGDHYRYFMLGDYRLTKNHFWEWFHSH